MRTGTFDPNAQAPERISLLDVLKQPTTVSTEQPPAAEEKESQPNKVNIPFNSTGGEVEQTASFEAEAPKQAFAGLINPETTANTIVSIIDTGRKMFYPRAFESIAFDSWELLELRAAQNAMRDTINKGEPFTPTAMQKILLDRQAALLQCNAKIPFTDDERKSIVEQLKLQIQDIEWLKYLEKWGWIVILLIGEYGRFSEVQKLKEA